MKHSPVDYVETRYESSDGQSIAFVMKEESSTFGSRPAGEPVRSKLRNLAAMTRGKVVIDFSEVPLVSSSFADEVFGKLFADLGPLEFMRKFEFHDVGDTVRSLIDRAIAQRMSGGQ
jgi:hypothetical protein